MARTIRSALHLEPGDTVDFSVCRRYQQVEVVRKWKDENEISWLEVRTGAGNNLKFPAMRLQNVEAEVER